MKISIGESLCDILFDKSGNLFVKHDKKMYIIEIDNKNNITLCKDENYNEDEFMEQKCDDTCDGNCATCPPKISKLCLVCDDDSTNKKPDEQNEVDDMYYPENKSFANMQQETRDDDEYEFTFSKTNQNVMINVVNSDDYPALYDTLVYDGCPDDNKLVFSSLCVGDMKLMYRLMVYTSGEFYFRPTGEKIKKNKLILSDDNELTFENIDES